ncbi:MAG TPA: endonuclease MutS2, partial [Firmicutes bacterium]|nr:endonuclease MutS2 [Bacillota bacterium]
MNEKTFRVLEFEKILTRLSTYASSTLGNELALRLRPSTASDEIIQWQAETTEACLISQSGDRVPLGGISDLRAALKKARLGGILAPEELGAVGATCRAARLLRVFFSGERAETAPTLAALAMALAAFPELEQEIERAIEPEGSVKDNASPQLARLRSQIRTFQNRVRDKLNALVHGGESRKYLQEALVTLRNGRYVIPVKQEYRQLIPGIVHDQSASGA